MNGLDDWPDWRPAAEVEIRALVQRYNSLGDAGRVEEFVALFTEDAVYRVSGEVEPYIGPRGLSWLVERARRDLLGWAGDDPVHLRHFTSTHQIDFLSDDEAVGRVHYQCLMAHGLDHWGRYVDRYRRVREGRWRFSERLEARDGMIQDGWCWALWGPSGTRAQGANT